MNSIINPTLDLFIYDLRNSLGDRPEEISKNREFFLDKIPETIRQKVLPEFEQDFDARYVHLLPERYAPFKSAREPIDGYYYPVRLGDTYSLILECTFLDKNQVRTPKDFIALKAEIEARLQAKKSTIGQTWVISGYLSESATPEQIEALAADCYQILIPDSDWKQDLDGKGSFLGATIFELSSQPLVKNLVEMSAEKNEFALQYSHVVIIIYPNQYQLKIGDKFYSDWVQLFYYHHKIVWAYGQSQIVGSSMKIDFSQIQSVSDRVILTSEQNLDYLRQALLSIQAILNDYTLKLNILDFQTGTIEINLSNYKKRVETIREKAKEKTTENTELEFLDKFTKLVADKYLLQIQKDSENFNRGLRLLENTNNTVRSQVEIEKAKSDRNFQDLVAVVGSITATVAILKEGKNECTSILTFIHIPKEGRSFCNYPLFYSLIIALGVGFLFWRLRKRLLS